MRFIPFAGKQILRVAKNNTENADKIVKNLTGPWETWLQIQISLDVLSQDATKNYKFEREKVYPGATQKICDFVVQPKNASAVKIWIELKVMLNSGPKNLIKRFKADVDKFDGLKGNFTGVNADDTGGAVAFSPHSAKTVLDEAYETFKEDSNKYSFAYWTKDQQSEPKWAPLSSNASVGKDDEQAILIYRNILAE